METARCPSGLPGFGFSMQAAAIASALVGRENAHIYRDEIRDWLDRIESPDGGVVGNMEEGLELAVFLTNLARVDAGLRAVDEPEPNERDRAVLQGTAPLPRLLRE